MPQLSVRVILCGHYSPLIFIMSASGGKVDFNFSKWKMLLEKYLAVSYKNRLMAVAFSPATRRVRKLCKIKRNNGK